MGTFSITIEISNLSGAPSRQLEALVDTGATHVGIPEDVLRDLGIQPTTARNYRLADERRVSYPVGYALLRVEGQEAPISVTFIPEGTEPLLGAVALETFLLAVDPINEKLVPVDGLMKMQKTITTRRLFRWLQRELDQSVKDGDSPAAAAFWLVGEELKACLEPRIKCGAGPCGSRGRKD